MSLYELTLVVDGFDLDNEFQNAGLECLTYDTIVSRTGGVTHIDAELDAASPVDAFLQVSADLRTINVSVIRIDPVLVGVTEIAERCEVSRETARLWTTGARREGFPPHYCSIGSSRFWYWADVEEWAVDSRLLDPQSRVIPAAIVEALNGALAHVRSADDGWLTPTQAPIAHIQQYPKPIRKGGWVDIEGLSA